MLITAGCGISQQSWPEWPTWPKYCSMVTDHCNIGGPAAGNQFISLSLMKKITELKPNCVIVTWSTYEKLDVFVDNAKIANEIATYPTRNFLLDFDGKVVKNQGWWPSSVSYDNPIKESYKRWQSNTLHAIITLQGVYMIQEICKKNNIPLYQFMSYDWPLNEWKTNDNTAWLYNLIDWNTFDSKILANDYFNSKWRNYQIGNDFGLIPTAGWHAEFFTNHIFDIIKKHCSVKDINLIKLMEAATVLTEKIYHANITKASNK